MKSRLCFWTISHVTGQKSKIEQKLLLTKKKRKTQKLPHSWRIVLFKTNSTAFGMFSTNDEAVQLTLPIFNPSKKLFKSKLSTFRWAGWLFSLPLSKSNNVWKKRSNDQKEPNYFFIKKLFLICRLLQEWILWKDEVLRCLAI